eukprot:scaffold27870_cov59-Phaeocystis_antarctica.AAC.2
MIDHATVQAQRDPSSRASSLCVRGPYYEYNVRGYAVLPVVDIRSRASLSCPNLRGKGADEKAVVKRAEG